MPAEDRPKVGAIANEVRIAVEGAIATRRQTLGSKELDARLAAERMDVTTPGRPIRRGSLHPINETIGAIAEVFGQFGFVVYEGPEVEDDTTNFRMLNIPPDHPARDLWDTLYVDLPDHLLRTHTSPGQIRVMRQERPPIRALLPGRCFRYEAVDASHASEFFQVEGLMVDEGTTMADLKGLLDQFAHAMFGADRATRFRPGYYPFTEPSVAFDILCVICDGAKCPACSKTGWMTILGAGMVHPVVLRYGGIDPERYQGFAFGMGMERIANLRHAVQRPAAVRRTTCASWGVLMRVPLSWLREYVDVELDARGARDRLTLLGMEVKAIERWARTGAASSSASCWPSGSIPNADRLSLTTVTRGRRGEPLSIVCGATNIAAGQRVPVALPGAVLPGDRRIERAEKMGVVSKGMLCSGDELGLTADADGILILPADTPLGVPLDDLVRRHRPGRRRQAQSRRRALDPRPRPRGRRRDRRAGPLAEEPRSPRRRLRRPPSGSCVEVDDRHGCPRFVGRWVDGVTVGPSPGSRPDAAAGGRHAPHQQRRRCLELRDARAGQADPHVRRGASPPRPTAARSASVAPAPGSGSRRSTTSSATLDPRDLLIADPSGPIGIAGVMGGPTSEVSDGTTRRRSSSRRSSTR